MANCVSVMRAIFSNVVLSGSKHVVVYMLLKLKFKYESECADCLFMMVFFIIIVIYRLLGC